MTTRTEAEEEAPGVGDLKEEEKIILADSRRKQRAGWSKALVGKRKVQR